ncbi:MAG: hypothetical protein M0Z84_11050 [Gammaproteobacteria bacterium]|nr:hypothetical protein [Gammaproteobacteria bacterium]
MISSFSIRAVRRSRLGQWSSAVSEIRKGFSLGIDDARYRSFM